MILLGLRVYTCGQAVATLGEVSGGDRRRWEPRAVAMGVVEAMFGGNKGWVRVMCNLRLDYMLCISPYH